MLLLYVTTMLLLYVTTILLLYVTTILLLYVTTMLLLYVTTILLFYVTMISLRSSRLNESAPDYSSRYLLRTTAWSFLKCHRQFAPSECRLCQAKVLTGGGDLREAQIDFPLSVSHFRV